MELFVLRFVSVSNKKILDKNCSEISLVGTNLYFQFLNKEENLTMESKYSIDFKEIKSDISSVEKVSKTIVIKNGEPCIQSIGLKSLAKFIKEKGFLLSLETYGTKPALIKTLVDGKLVDMITLKLYCPLYEAWMKKMSSSSLLTNYQEMIENIKKTLSILRSSKIKINVRTIVVPSLLYRKQDINCIAKEVVKINNVTLYLEPFKPENCSKLFMNIKQPSSDFMNDIKDYIKQRYPMLKVI